jgi:hypothetical protein
MREYVVAEEAVVETPRPGGERKRPATAKLRPL